MSIIVATFPDEVWDGSSLDHGSVLVSAAPSNQDYSKIVAEIIALETYVLDHGYTGEIVDDITPQLGGNLDMNEKSIQTVTPTEMAYVHGVTSAIQTQLTGCVKKSTGVASDSLVDADGNTWTVADGQLTLKTPAG
jgi:hypothetical protein